jgi:hypothetical protein
VCAGGILVQKEAKVGRRLVRGVDGQEHAAVKCGTRAWAPRSRAGSVHQPHTCQAGPVGVVVGGPSGGPLARRDRRVSTR